MPTTEFVTFTTSHVNELRQGKKIFTPALKMVCVCILAFDFLNSARTVCIFRVRESLKLIFSAKKEIAIFWTHCKTAVNGSLL